MEENKHALKVSPFGKLFRFIGLWMGFTGLYAAFSVCPFCGQPGCPVGVATSGAVGGFFALCFQDWKRLISYLRSRKNGTRAAAGSTDQFTSPR